MKKYLFLALTAFIAVGAFTLVNSGRLVGIDLKSMTNGFKGPDIIGEDKYANEDIINILVFGLDRRSPTEASRSDTIMVLTLDKKNKKIKLSSLMRDMYVPIPGNNSNKINAAYAYGGSSLAIETINNNFGLNIKDYITADFFGFPKIIDTIGGVEVNIKPEEVPLSEVQNPGLQVLNGKQTLAYCRIREVGNADFERTERQRRVLNEIYKKVKAMDSKKRQDFITEIIPNVETSLNPREISDIASQMLGFDLEKIEELRIPVNGLFKNEKINGASCLVPDIEENKKLLHEFIFGSSVPTA